MTRSVVAVALLLVVAGGVGAQQFNSFTSTMIFNGQDGPPFPINPVNFPRGTNSNVALSGLPNAPFVVFASNSLAVGSAIALGGSVDINLFSGFAVAVDGLANPIWSLDPFGSFVASFPISGTTPLGASRCWQGVIADFTNPAGASLTAATRTVVTQGVTTTTLSVGSNSYATFALNTYQISVPFYASSYSTIFVNQDGSVGFQQGSGDFTPTDSEFLTQMPRIAAMWTDLEPGGASNINVVVDQTVPTAPTVRVNWVLMLEWAGTGVPHTFSIVMYATPQGGAPTGQIDIIHSNFNNPAQYDVLTGITPGALSGSVVQYPWTTLSAAGPSSPAIGTANQPIYEWFGLPNFPYYSPGLNNPFDLTGKTLTFSATNPGVTGARYTLVTTQTPIGF